MVSPQLAWPDISFDKVVMLLPSAFTIAMLGAIESLLSAVVADGMAGTRHNSNQELIGQGIANIVSPLFGGIAATGAIARTATNYRNGANSPLAGIVHSATLVLILLLLAPLAAKIPLCTLAAILFVVAWNMSEVKHFVKMTKTAPRADVAVLLITFGLTILTDLVVAVNIGIILALLQFLRRMASSVEVRPLSAEQIKKELGSSAGIAAEGVMVFSIEGPLFFGAVENLEQTLEQSHDNPRAIVIRLEHVPFMDITGIQALSEAMVNLENRGIRALLCEANQRVLRKLVRAELVRRDQDPAHYFSDLNLALEHAQGIGSSRQETGPQTL
jgi:SulP family sulfate permease